MLAVVAAFFGGLAVGAFALGPRIERSARPVRWYAGCELVIALWSLLLLFAMPPFSAWLLRADRRAAGAGVAMVGGVLRDVRAAAARDRGDGRHAAGDGALTAQMRSERRGPSRRCTPSNTFGAVLGVLAAAFWLVPALGLARTAASASRSICCAA